MISKNIITIMGTALGLLATGAVFGAVQPVDRIPNPQVLVAGQTYTVTGRLEVRHWGRPGPGMIPMSGNSVYIVLDAPLYRTAPTDALERVDSIALIGGAGVADLVRWVQVVQPAGRIEVKGVYTHLYYALGATERFVGSAPYEVLQIAGLKVEGRAVTQPAAGEAQRLERLARQRVMEWYLRRPVIYDGPEPRIAASAVLDSDHVSVDVYSVSGWGHVPMAHSMVRFLYTASTDAVENRGQVDAPVPSAAGDSVADASAN